MVIINSDAFTKQSLAKANYSEDPLPDLRSHYNLVEIPLTKLNREAIKGLDLSARDGDRSKNFFALGLMCWLYDRPMESTIRWLESRFDGAVLEANIRVLKAGFAFGETTDLFPVSFTIPEGFSLKQIVAQKKSSRKNRLSGRALAQCHLLCRHA